MGESLLAKCKAKGGTINFCEMLWVNLYLLSAKLKVAL